ncbi:MAG: LysR family transcriptional regulator [Polyangiaceae bacterium]
MESGAARVSWLNYHHLFYFWTVAREGGLVAGAKRLKLAPPTVSAQLATLEESLGEALFEKRGRRIVLTAVGQLAFEYADEIFTLGRELVDAVRGAGKLERPMHLRIGLADVVPKLIARRLIEPVFALPAMHVVCREDNPQRLLAELAAHELDLVIVDQPLGALSTSVRVHAHLLGSSGISVLGAPPLAKLYAKDFPRSLDGAPILLPTESSSVRRGLDAHFAELGVRPRVVAEFDDSALLKAFAETGRGLVVAPRVIEREVMRQHRVERVGRIDDVQDHYFAVTRERRARHPAIVSLTEAAHQMFAQRPRTKKRRA